MYNGLMTKKRQYFNSVDSKVSFPELEEKLIKHWKENKIFEKSVNSKSENKTWTFLDGPPFVTGLPHYGSLLSSIAKDVFARFWTMKGYRVRRVWGWDGHGLPIENKVENKLGIERKKDIEDKVGVKKFIDQCMLYVNEVSSEWEWYVDHVGRWADFNNAYKTWDLDYMESVMWVFKKMYEGGYIYKGLRVSLFCPHCSTPISNFEVAMDSDNYKEIAEPANIYKYQLADEKDTYFLAWSTTPWNKIATPALAVNPKLKYVKVLEGKEKYILAKSTLKILKEKKHKILEEFDGKALLGKKFVPHYDYYKIDKGKKAFVVAGGDFVTADEGTGIVTIAAYGEDDLDLMKKENIQIVLHVDEEGILKQDVPRWAGMYYLKVNKLVNDDLAGRGLIYKEEQYRHKVPNCWRCGTRLFYNPQNAWFIDIQKLKPKMKETNESVNWYPNHFKKGRFLKSMEAAPDWCISRTRYWGSPVPVWECECGERFVPESIADLEKTSGQKIISLHKPEIDEVKVKCNKCGKSSSRVPEVLDSWIEAGSASFAERHFPFEKSIKLEDFFPPDFIAEYTGQIRAWFYVLHVIATAIYESNAFTNVVVTGVILGTDGRKMSKNYGNYPDPKEMLQKHGGDALRLYMMGSSAMKGEDILISEEHYRNQTKGMLLILWNVYNFFITYSNLDGWSPKTTAKTSSRSELDAWILSLLNNLIENITKDLEEYDTVNSIAKLREFVNQFSTWYIRRSRQRVGIAVNDGEDKLSFYNTCYEVLTKICLVLAPITPFIAEEIYRNLAKEESVHLASWPKANKALIDNKLEEEMNYAKRIVEMAHSDRKISKIKVRQPLNSLDTIAPIDFSEQVKALIKDEINVLNVSHKKGKKVSINLDVKTMNKELRAMGEARDTERKIQIERKAIGTSLDEKIDVYLPNWPKKFERF